MHNPKRLFSVPTCILSEIPHRHKQFIEMLPTCWAFRKPPMSTLHLSSHRVTLLRKYEAALLYHSWITRDFPALLIKIIVPCPIWLPCNWLLGRAVSKLRGMKNGFRKACIAHFRTGVQSHLKPKTIIHEATSFQTDQPKRWCVLLDPRFCVDSEFTIRIVQVTA